jgi:hypothetical protein
MRMSMAIRTEATKVYSKMRSLFALPAGANFAEHFDGEVKAYQEATKDVPVEKLLLLVKDPAPKL